jgi:hypothetical protein
VRYAAFLLLSGVAAAGWIAATALMLSVFLHPVVSAAIALGAAYARFAVTSSAGSLPALRPRDYFSTNFVVVHNWLIIFVLAEVVIIFFVASKLFSLRDVAVSIE